MKENGMGHAGKPGEISGGKNSPKDKPSLYLYPITPYMYQNGSNQYILRLKGLLQQDFHVVNKVTRLGIFDILLKLRRCDILYFNWIADLPDKRFGYLQMVVLFFILIASRIFGIKIAWFIHNDISHYRKNLRAKKMIRRMMMTFSDIAFSHSKELSISSSIKNLKVFDHPVDEMQELEENKPYKNDVLIWGSVSPYKGVHEFARFNHSTDKLDQMNILVAGKFSSPQFFETVSSFSKSNIRFINKVLPEAELRKLFEQSRYVLFCYKSASVLSSAALCQTLAYGKTVIGPGIGAFKELGRKGLIYTYDSFDELAALLAHLKTTGEQIDKKKITDYTRSVSWEGFRNFLSEHLLPTASLRMELSPASA